MLNTREIRKRKEKAVTQAAMIRGAQTILRTIRGVRPIRGIRALQTGAVTGKRGKYGISF